MRILLTNDDGLRAPGIHAMHTALTDAMGDCGGPLAEDVFPCAPLTVQSATSHGMTFHQPLMVSEIDVSATMRGVAVDGRPADCVKLAFASLWAERFGEKSRPDLVVSGINAGANVGINVIYSGTVAAALEASFLGAPSIAVSLHLGATPPRWDVAGRWARETIDAIIAGGLLDDRDTPSPPCLNVNIPICDGEGPAPAIRVCSMNMHGHADVYERRTNPAGEVYYWTATHGLDFRDRQCDADVDLLFQRYITVTPLWHDMTDVPAISTWRDRLCGGAS